MHTRRLAAFLLGAWLGGSLLMILITAANLTFTNSLLRSLSDPAAALMKRNGAPQDVALLLKYETSEQNRRYTEIWQRAQVGLGLALAACLFLGTQRRVFPIVVCALMMTMVVFQLLGVSSELAFRGREADFPPANTDFNTVRRIYALGQIFAWVEGAKMVLGVLLAGYLFIFRARRVRKQPEAVAYPRQNAVGG